MKTSLCETCVNGLVRETESWKENDNTKFTTTVCMEDQGYVDVVTKCNRYIKSTVWKETFHDPEYEDYEKKVEEEK